MKQSATAALPRLCLLQSFRLCHVYIASLFSLSSLSIPSPCMPVVGTSGRIMLGISAHDGLSFLSFRRCRRRCRFDLELWFRRKTGIYEELYTNNPDTIKDNLRYSGDQLVLSGSCKDMRAGQVTTSRVATKPRFESR